MYDPGLHRVIKRLVPHMNKLRADADLQIFPLTVFDMALHGVGQRQVRRGETDAAGLRLHVDQVHPGAADEIADKGVARPLEQFPWRAELDDLAAVHHRDLVGEGRGLQLIVGDVDHGDVELLVDLLELAPQFPLQVRVDHRQRFIEEDRGDVVTHQTTAHRDFLFFVGGEVARLLAQEVLQVEHFGNFLHLAVHFRLGHALIAQGKREVIEHGHGVVDHRKLENLGDVALLRRQVVDRFAVEQHMALRRAEQAGDDVEQG